jgi:membrane protease YdiL (CAAX protease family)
MGSDASDLTIRRGFRAFLGGVRFCDAIQRRFVTTAAPVGRLYGIFSHIIHRMHLEYPPSSPGPFAANRARTARQACLVGAAVLALLAVATVAPAAWIALLLTAPVVEEVVFRAGVQEQLLRRLPGRQTGAAFAANALTALAFAAAHMAAHADTRAALTAVPALLIGRVYQHRRRLAPCIALHALFNAAWLLWTGVAT